MDDYFKKQLLEILTFNIDDINEKQNRLEQLIRDLLKQGIPSTDIREFFRKCVTDFEGMKFDLEWAKGIIEKELD